MPFTLFTLQHAGDLEKNIVDYESIVDQTLSESSAQIDQNRQKVLNLLLGGVSECDPKIHRNAELKLRVRKGGKEEVY